MPEDHDPKNLACAECGARKVVREDTGHLTCRACKATDLNLEACVRAAEKKG